MEKSYDIKELGKKIQAKAKEQGLELAEEAIETLAKAALDGTIEWAEESAAMTPTIIDDLGIQGVKQLKHLAYTGVEKLDLNGDGK